MNNVLRKIEIDLYSPTSYEVIKAQQGDKNSRIIEFILYDQGEPYEFTNNIFFRFVGHRGDGSSFTKTEEECIVRNGNHIKVTLLEDILYYAGIIEAKLVMYELDEKKYEKTILSTIPFKISCIKNPCNENELTAGEYSIVTDLIFQMKEFSKNAQDIIDTAAESAVNAKDSENNAKASETKANASETNAKNSEVNAANSASAAKTSETNAAASATSADAQAKQAQSYAIGTGNVRPNEAADNAKYYYEQSKDIYENFESAGNVTGVKGENEPTFRTGNVTLTPENIGSPSNEYMEEHFVPDYVSQYSGAISSKGWYRIAQKKGSAGFGESCVVIIKRYYNSPSPEYQKVQLVDSYRSNKIIPIVSFTGSDGTHMFKKIRKVNDPQNLISYIEIYQDRDTHPNGILVDILEAQDRYGKKWEVVDLVPTQETVEGINVLASLDLPADFDISMFLGKSGGAMDGLINFVNNGGIRFVAPDAPQTARGIVFRDKDGNDAGGIGILAMGGVPKYIYASLGGHDAWEQSAGLAIYADKMKWKNSEVITESSGTAKKSMQDGSGNVISDTYALKNIYGDSTVSMGRKSDSIIGNSSFAFGNGVVASGMYAHAEGVNTTASGAYSHAEGGNTTANTMYAHTEGNNTTASNYSSHSCGKYNKPMVVGGAFNTQIGDAFVIGNGTGDSSRSNALRVTYLGDILGTKAFQSSGADYAEFIKPWWDGNLYGEDRVGYFITVKDGLLYKANEGDYILGITSGNPSVVGNADEEYYWKYERDEFNRIVMEEVPEMERMKDKDGNPMFDEETHEPVMVETGKMVKNARMKLAENYDPSKQESYVPRAERKEWDYVGMIGVLPVRDDGTCRPGRFCKCREGGIATLAEKRDFDTFYVIERIAEDVVSVILK